MFKKGVIIGKITFKQSEKYWQKIILEDLPGGRAPQNIKITKYKGKTPLLLTNYHKIINFYYIGRIMFKKGVIIGKVTYLTFLQGEKKYIYGIIQNSGCQHPEKVLLKVAR